MNELNRRECRSSRLGIEGHDIVQPNNLEERLWVHPLSGGEIGARLFQELHRSTASVYHSDARD